MKHKGERGGFVYSSEHGRMCPACGRPVAQCACQKARAKTAAAASSVVRVGRETRGRRGKGVTVVTGVPLRGNALEALGSQLKRRCGSGGTVRDGVIEIQGDHRDLLVDELSKHGWGVKRSGMSLGRPSASVARRGEPLWLCSRLESWRSPMSTLPPMLALYWMGVGHYHSRALGLAAKLGLADLLKDGPRDARELAKSLDLDAPALKRVLRLLASIGVFEEQASGAFGLTPIGELLRSDVPGSMRASVMLFAGTRIQDSWKELEYCVRTGEPAFRKDSPHADPFTQMAQDPEAAANFDKAMATFAPQTAAAVAAAYDFSAFETLVDVGGGNGALLLGILKANPRLRGIVFDQPHVAERARENLQAEGFADRCQVVGGSFFDGVPTGADAYLLKHVIHDWNDERATAILKNVRAAMPPSGRLLIVEGVYPPRIDQSLESRGAAANDVNMLVCTGGRQRSEQEFRDLYAACGFELTRVVPTPARVCVIEGELA